RLKTLFGIDYRMGIVVNDNTVVDVNRLWTLKFERDNRYNAVERANYFSPNSLHKILNLKDNPIGFFQESLELYNKFKKDGSLHLSDTTSIEYKLNDNDNDITL